MSVHKVEQSADNTHHSSQIERSQLSIAHLLLTSPPAHFTSSSSSSPPPLCIMRFSATLSAIAIAAVSLASATAATSIAPRQAATNYVGYLATTFIGNDPNIFQHLSRGNDPTSFRALNGGKAVLSASGVGTGGVRDPYLASNGRDYFIIGTDLDIGKVRNLKVMIRL